VKTRTEKQTAMTAFAQEREKIRNKIWSLLELRSDEKVLDVGVGRIAYSLKKLIELGVPVTSIDLNRQVLQQHKTPNVNAVQCNAARIPFRKNVFHTALVNFTFHEINPALHQRVVSELCRVSGRIVIVEPAFSEDPLCRRFQEIWTESMHSVSKFEDFKSMESWTDLVRGSGARVTHNDTFQSRVQLCGEEAKEYMKTVVDELRKEGVSEKYIKEMQKLAKNVEEEGMLFSDVNLIIAEV
jgi:ubiquinone/menaquinone biosynthesis C-methylase UbiE